MNGSDLSFPPRVTTSSLETPNHNGSLSWTEQQQQQPLDWADAARAEWRRYGPNVTQALEEMRTSGPLSVRVVGAESRVDICGAEYTVYLVHVHHHQQQQQHAADGTPSRATHDASSPRYRANAPTHPNINNSSSSSCSTQWTVERRFSDFVKLAAILPIISECPFPAKHWAGRLGSWTPARTWAPLQYATLIQERQVQLDAWLVHVVMLAYHHAAYSHSSLAVSTTPPTRTTTVSWTASQQQAIHDFLTLQQSAPPYTATPASSSAGSPSNHQGVNSWQWHNPVTFTLGSAIRQATVTLAHMCPTGNMGWSNQKAPLHGSSLTLPPSANTSIPIDLLQAATGLLFLTVAKVGMVVSGRVGTGLLIAKLPRQRYPNDDTLSQNCHWSAPVAVGTIGMGWGALIGGDVTHALIVLTTEQAVADLAQGGALSSLQVGAELGLSVGPTGRFAAAATTPRNMPTGGWQSASYAYAISSGLFVGVSLEGSVLRIRHDVNTKFYGRHVAATELLTMAGVPAAEPLYAAIDAAMACPLPETAFRPSRLWQSSNAASPAMGTNDSVVHRNTISTAFY
jgi:lipid-binding SYLF domain-containing protein